MRGPDPAGRMAVIVVVAALSAVATGYVLDRWGDATGAPPPSARLDDQEARLRALESRIEGLAAHLEASGRQAPWRSLAGEPAARAALEREFEDPAAIEADRDRRFARLDAAFSNERTDTRWAPTTQRRLEAIGMSDAILSIEPEPPAERRVECRARTCRMEFVFANEGDATDWALAYVTGIGSNLQQVQYAVQRLPDGTARVLMFGAR